MLAGNCHCPPAPAHSRQAAHCYRDERSWPVRAPRPPGPAAPRLGAPLRIAGPRRRPWGWHESDRDRIRPRAEGRRRGLLRFSRPATPWCPTWPQSGSHKAPIPKSRTTLWTQEVSRSDNVGATAGACTLTWRRRLTRNASQFNPKFQLNMRGALVRPEPARRYQLRASRPRALTGLDVLIELFDLIDEFSAELATDPPCQPTLAWVAG